jgi:hypothetical protein
MDTHLNTHNMKRIKISDWVAALVRQAIHKG